MGVEKYREEVKNMSAKKEWEHWGKLKSFRLYEGVWLQRGHLPQAAPQKGDSFSYKDKMINSDKDFQQILASLRADEKVKEGWCDISKWDAAHKIITADVFFKHWKACGLLSKARFPKPSRIKPQNDNPRARATLVKMLVGMAMDKYKYDPRSGIRTGTASSIKTALAKYGMSLDEQTILDYLREGSEFLSIEVIEQFKSK